MEKDKPGEVSRPRSCRSFRVMGRNWNLTIKALASHRCKKLNGLCFPKIPLVTVLRMDWSMSKSGKGSPAEEAVGTFQAGMTAQTR